MFHAVYDLEAQSWNNKSIEKSVDNKTDLRNVNVAEIDSLNVTVTHVDVFLK